MSKKPTKLQLNLYRIPLFLAAIMVASIGLVPFLVPDQASAAQITSRKVTIGSAQPSASTSYSFSFTTATSAFHLDGIKLIACSSAIGSYPGGTCTAPTGFSFASATYGSISGFTDTTVFTIDAAGANDCIATAHPEVLCLKRTSVSNDTAGPKTLVINAVVNPNNTYLTAPNYSFYIGITTYNSNTWPSGGRQDSGTVAAAVVQSLQVSAVVAEILQFCVGTTSDNTGSTSIGSCSSVSGTTVNLGTLDPTAINVSPVNTNGGNNVNGVAVLRTNAINGSTVSYDAIQDTDSGSVHHGSLKIQGVSCSTTPSSCINSAGAAQTTFTAGTQDFGMTIFGINCQTASTYYACSYTGGTEHLVPQSNYIGQAGAFGTSNGFAWVESGASTNIAAAAANNTVADEAIILKFAATPSITTTFGSYSVKADFIATPTY